MRKKVEYNNLSTAGASISLRAVLATPFEFACMGVAI